MSLGLSNEFKLFAVELSSIKAIGPKFPDALNRWTCNAVLVATTKSSGMLTNQRFYEKAKNLFTSAFKIETILQSLI